MFMRVIGCLCFEDAVPVFSHFLLSVAIMCAEVPNVTFLMTVVVFAMRKKCTHVDITDLCGIDL